jgi:Staphylococcal nuclease homologue
VDAAKRLKELLKQGSVRIIPHGKDVYDRLVADVFVDGQNVAEMLQRRASRSPTPNRHKIDKNTLGLKAQSSQDIERVLTNIPRQVACYTERDNS